MNDFRLLQHFKMIGGVEVKTHSALSHPLKLTLLDDWSQNQRPTQIQDRIA